MFVLVIRNKQMALEVIKEVTVWDVDYRQPNHVYLMDGEKVLAYQKWGEGEPIYYDTKRKLDKRKRQFVKVKVSPFNSDNILVKKTTSQKTGVANLGEKLRS
jgi:hypothetical protein